MLVYSALGAVAALINAGFGAYYIASLAAYSMGLCVVRYVDYRRNHDKLGISTGLNMLLPMAAGIILTHLCQGIYFLRGAFKKGHFPAAV